ncbi:hypothetical protein L7F22_008906 [Adiantum nelumboides]|nr:hypothetical protein [Adiantum nelumboides]
MFNTFHGYECRGFVLVDPYPPERWTSGPCLLPKDCFSNCINTKSPQIKSLCRGLSNPYWFQEGPRGRVQPSYGADANISISDALCSKATPETEENTPAHHHVEDLVALLKECAKQKDLLRDTKELSDIGIQCISHYDWHEDPLGTPIFRIPKNENFHINGVAFEVRLSCIQGAGYGLFVHSAIESGVTILHYGEPKYSFQEWKTICKLIPRAIKYSLVEDPKVEEEEDRAYILGFVEEGNVSGYINSSHCMDFHPNVRYALDPNLPPWYKGIFSHIKSEEYGHICIETICQVEPGEELFADYEFT